MCLWRLLIEAAFIVFDVYEVMMTMMMNIVDDTCSLVFPMREKKFEVLALSFYSRQLFGKATSRHVILLLV